MPQPGDLGLVPIPGLPGKLVNAGQTLIGCRSRYQHAFLVLPDGMVAEAQPGGVVTRPLSDYAGAGAAYSSFPLTDSQRGIIVGYANANVRMHTPYSWVDYVALGLYRWHMPSALLREYVHDSGHMICSQLVASAYYWAGFPLTSRHPQDVAPGDLAQLIGAH
jgi:hypothetical protein